MPPEVPNQWTLSHLSRPVSKAFQKQLPKGLPWGDKKEVSACVMSRAIDAYMGIDLPCT